MKISIVRGAFTNPFELQNFYPLKGKHQIQVISSKNPISQKIDLPLIKLWSPTDLLSFPFKYPILNRLFIDAHYLFGLENAITGSDVVHVAETYFHYTHQAIRAKQKGLVKKVVSTCWEIILHNNESLPGRKKFKQLARNYFDHFICPTVLAKKVLIAEGTDPNKISIIRMGIDLKRFRPTRKIHKGTIKILFIGRLVEEKGVRELLNAYKQVKVKGLKIKLTLIGSGPLKAEAIASGAEVKQVAYEKIHLQYQRADIFCLPSKNTATWQEQYGMVLVEAMACGLPIITSGNGAIREVCGKAALYASSGKEIAAAITKFATDNSLRKKLSHISRERALQEFDSQKIAKQIEQVYLKKLTV